MREFTSTTYETTSYLPLLVDTVDVGVVDYYKEYGEYMKKLTGTPVKRKEYHRKWYEFVFGVKEIVPNLKKFRRILRKK
jgi:hypothetical protein